MEKTELPPQSRTVELKSNQKGSFCTCGASKTLPYCDNSHRELNAATGTCFRPLKIWPKEDVSLEVYCGNWEGK